MSTLPPTASLQQIQAEILYMRGLIGALDETSDSYVERKMELDMEISDLEQRYKKKQTEHMSFQNDDDDDDEVMRIINGTNRDRASGTSDAGAAAHHTSALSGVDSSAMDFGGFAGNESNLFSELDGGNGGEFWNGPSTATNDWSFADLDHSYPAQSTTAAQATGESSSSDSSPQQTSAESSPSFVQLPSRKRPRDSLAVNNSTTGEPEMKSIRATPSPAITAPTTPSSIESFDMPDDPEFIRLTGGNPKGDMEDFKQTQKEILSMIEQERKSAELAKRLNDEEFSRPLRLSQPSSQAMLDFNGRGFRPMDPPPARTFPATSSTLSNAIETKQNNHSARVGLPPCIKEEWHPKPDGKTPPKVIPAGFIDLGSDSSDLEEIEPKDFIDSGRKSRPQADVSWIGNGSNYTSMPTSNGFARKGSWADVEQLDASAFRSDPMQAIQDPALVTPNMQYPAFTGFGATDVYGAGSSAAQQQPPWYLDAAGMIGQGFASAAQGVTNAAYSFLDGHINTYPGALTGYGGAGLPGSSNNPQLVSSSPDVNYFGYPHQPSVQSATITNPALFPVPNGSEHTQNYLDRYDYLTNDPTRTREEIKSLLENIRPDEDLPENREGDPEAMKYPLMPHQKLGLTWMRNMEEGSNKGGILADDMGLGKTIQALALMVSRKSPDPTRKTNLIVAPVALMKQWEREIEKKLKSGSHALSTYILHGSKRDTTFADLKRYDVVLTTFGTLANELKRKEGIDMKKRANPNWQPSGKADRLPLLADECKWYRVIIDEAQCIKNKATKAAQGASHLQALTRFCMSGTPMMNNVGELYSLIHFLRIKPYNESERFNRDFTRPLKSNSQTSKDQAMRKLQALLKAILLRRTKKSKIDGQPILNLPQRTTEPQHAVFSEDEEAFYRALETNTQLQFNKYLKAGTVGNNYTNVLVLLLRLRQACCHPHLIKDFGILTGNPDASIKDMLALAAELAPEVVERIKSESAFECPVCYDGVENPAIFIPCGHSTCSECFAKISDPAQALAHGDEDAANIKCPNCRGRIVPSKVIDYNAFKQVHMPEEGQAGNSEVSSTGADVADEETASETESEDGGDSDDSDDDLDGFVVDDDVVDDGSETESEDEGEEGYRRGKTPFEKSKPKKDPKGKKSVKKDVKGKGKAKERKAPRKTLAQLKAESMRNIKARRKYMRRLERDWVSSAKIEKTMEILTNIQNRRDGEKTIIFSQFTSLLDLLEVPISRKNWGYKRYDGSMTSTQRNDAVLAFTDKPDCKIMLVSLKAGNAGLNLVAASQVIIFDPFWNPYIEEQAIDRAHRIGQMRPVQVHRVLVENTVEDRILALQEKKRQLIEGALDEKASQNIGRLGTRELAFLF
ncbi:MAG: hypothetical protein M1830_005415, partial [Pleopsidium flavum]